MTTKRGYTLGGNTRALLRDAGVDERVLLRLAGLPDDLFSQQSVTLSSADYYRLWNAFEQTADVDAFPLVVAQSLSVESFSPALFAALCSPDLTTAVDRISRFKSLMAPISLDIEEGPVDLTITLRWSQDDPPPPASLELTELAFFVALARIATRERIVPVRATTPDIAPVTPAYKEYFGIEIEAGAAVSISFSGRDAKRPFLTANEQLWEVFAPQLSRRLMDLDSGANIIERVSAVLLEHLPSGLASLEAVAEKLIMSKRTLQRKLRAEGTSFQEVLKNLRKEISVHYLTGTELTATEISYLVGFEDANSFFRAFAEWTGSTPKAVRESSVAHT